jgi:hypothetical protein
LKRRDFFLWGFLKKKLFPVKPRDVLDMIIFLCNEADEDMCRWDITDVRVPIQEAVTQNGGHVEQVL